MDFIFVIRYIFLYLGLVIVFLIGEFFVVVGGFIYYQVVTIRCSVQAIVLYRGKGFRKALVRRRDDDTMVPCHHDFVNVGYHLPIFIEPSR